MIKYQIKSWRETVERVEVTRETAACVYVLDIFSKSEHRRLKSGEIFDTYAEARSALINRYEERVNDAELQLQRERERLERIKRVCPESEPEAESSIVPGWGGLTL